MKNVLPTRPVGAFDWAYGAWDGVAGAAVTVPIDALQALLDAYVDIATLRAALEQRVKVTVETAGEPAQEHAGSAVA